MSELFDKLRLLLPGRPQAALILGSGLGAFAQQLTEATSVSVTELKGYPQSTVPGHAGRILMGKAGEVTVLCFQGRIHLYEGYTLGEVTLPVRIAHEFGCRILIVTNAAGGIERNLCPGDFLLIEDHINLQFRNPLRHRNLRAEERFIDMSEPYDRDLRSLALEAAREEGIPLKMGVLGALLGPSYETPAEVRMLARLGGSAACMSTIPEVILARALGLRVLGISCITNRATGTSPAPLHHGEVQAVAARMSHQFSTLLMAILKKVSESLAQYSISQK
ncbi:MAG: purine-nucleoside phosphorylase [bacterium]